MNPPFTQLISNDAVHNQSSPQGLSKTFKKKTKGKTIFDLIGGVGSFANMLKKSGSILSTEKNGDGKKDSIQTKGSLVGANNKREKELPGNMSLKAEKNLLIKKEEKIAGKEDVTQDKELSLGGTMKQSAEASSSNAVLVERTERKIFLGKLENSQFVKGGKAVDGDKSLDITKALYGQHSDAARNESTSEPGNTVSVMKDMSGEKAIKKSASGESMSTEDEFHRDLKPATTNAAKENIHVRNFMPEDMRLIRTGDENKDHRPAGNVDLSKGFEMKGVTARESSPAAKEQDVLLKSNSLNPEVAQEKTIPTNKVNQVNEVAQEYKNLFTHGRPLEKHFEGSFNDAPVMKTDTSPWTAQADISGVKGTVNYGSWSNMRAHIAASVQFQDIMDQIEDSAAQMLKKGPGRILITLEPPNLGTLNVDVKVHNDMVRLVLIADNHEVKQVLHSNLDQLKTALQDQGLNMDRFDVLVQQRSSENPGFHQWSGTLFGEGRGRREDTREDGVLPQPIPVHSEGNDDRHQGIISVFV